MFQFVFGLSAERISYYGAKFFGQEFFGAGADSVESAIEDAARVAASYAKTAQYETGRFRVSVRKPCRTCKVTGIKPGCKRKACVDCAGRGTTDVAEYRFSAEAK